MLTSLIFHLVFGVFIVAILIALLMTRNKIESFQHVVLPLLLNKEIIYPKSRSQLIRCLDFLEHELQETFQCKVKIQFHFFETLERSVFLDPLFFLVAKNFDPQSDLFLFQGQPCSVMEIFQKLNSLSKKGKVCLIHSGKKQDSFWLVEYDDTK